MGDLAGWLGTHKDSIQAIKDLATAFAILIAGGWAIFRFYFRREFEPCAELDVSLIFVGRHADDWLVEVVSSVKNVGSCQLKITNFTFDLRLLDSNAVLVRGDSRISGQACIPTKHWEGSWLPEDAGWIYTYVNPGITTRYSYVASIPTTAQFALVHGKFEFKVGWPIRFKLLYTADRLQRVPSAMAMPTANAKEGNVSGPVPAFDHF